MVGAVVAAGITGLFSLITLTVSKDNKVSDARQRWLDGLRKDTANFLGGIDTLMRLVEPKINGQPAGLPREELRAFREARSELYQHLNEMRFRMLLRLDPEDSYDKVTHAQVINNVNALTDAFFGPCDEPNIKTVRELQPRVVDGTRKIIKGTWTRVKQGEGTFTFVRTALEVAVVVIFAALIALFIYAATVLL